MNSINLNSLDGIPKYFINELQKYENLFTGYEFLEYFMEEEPIRDIICRKAQTNVFVAQLHLAWFISA